MGAQFTTLGEVVERVDGFSVEWTVQDIFNLKQKENEGICSPPFSFGGVYWRLLMFPNGQTSENSKGDIDVYLIRGSSGDAVELSFSFGVKTANKEIDKERHHIFNFKGRSDRYGTCRFLFKNELSRRKKELAPSNQLTIVCRMKFPEATKSLKKFTFSTIRRAANDFDEKLGSGGFGSVYKGEVGGHAVALKMFEGIDEKLITEEFITELKTLASFKHRFLLSITGYCDYPAHPCLVLEYMPNGCLKDRLACKDNTAPLPWDIRLVIAYCCTLGINHLHSAGQVHRDIKSANILLDENLFPRVADFGLVRIGESGESSIVQVTLNFSGTPAYMAPEAFEGDVSTKLDTFAFGVVLLELLTGLPAMHDGKRLWHYIDDIMTMLDARAQWNTTVASKMYEIAKRCLISEKKPRPTISQVTTDLEAIVPAIHNPLRMLIKNLSLSS